MSKYNQLAISTNPSFYLSAPVTTDQSSAGIVALSSNNLSAIGQPVVYGNTNSFLVTDSTGVVLDRDIVFVEGNLTEFVMLSQAPAGEVGVLSTDIDSGIFLTPDAVMLRVSSILEDMIFNQVIQVKIKEWESKKHVVVSIGSSQVSLTVNGISNSSSFQGDIISGSTMNIGAGSDYAFLLDGLGVYPLRLIDKSSTINDFGSAHNVYASILHGGQTTKFDTFVVDEINLVELKDFHIEAADLETRSLVYSFLVSQTSQPNKYLVFKSNNDSTIVEYDISGGAIVEFQHYDSVELSDSNVVVSFRIPLDVPSDFQIEVTTVLDANILSQTPADLIVDGTPVFPNVVDESIVNCPEGVWLAKASYTGTWKPFEQAGSEPPKTIELLFKPNDSTETVVIFDSSDGSVTTASQSGYILWLNGVEVADLTDIKWNQWNHLILVNDTASATEFSINTDGSSDPMNINFQFLSAYPTELVQAEIEQLYAVVAGIDIISVAESELTFAEGEFDNGLGFQVINLTWAIVGAGGS